MPLHLVNAPVMMVVSFPVEADNFMQARILAEQGKGKQQDRPENIEDFTLDWDEATAHEVNPKP
jgi:hypothetical protein